MIKVISTQIDENAISIVRNSEAIWILNVTKLCFGKQTEQSFQIIKILDIKMIDHLYREKSLKCLSTTFEYKDSLFIRIFYSKLVRLEPWSI